MLKINQHNVFCLSFHTKSFTLFGIKQNQIKLYKKQQRKFLRRLCNDILSHTQRDYPERQNNITGIELDQKKVVNNVCIHFSAIYGYNMCES